MNYDENGNPIDYLKSTSEILESEGVHQDLEYTLLENVKDTFKSTRGKDLKEMGKAVGKALANISDDYIEEFFESIRLTRIEVKNENELYERDNKDVVDKVASMFEDGLL